MSAMSQRKGKQKDVKNNKPKKKKSSQTAQEERTANHKKAFLKAYLKHRTIFTAARATNIDRRTVHRWRETDEDFSEAFNSVDLDISDSFKKRLYARALNKRNGSDSCLMFIVKAKCPDFAEVSTIKHKGFPPMGAGRAGKVDITPLVLQTYNGRQVLEIVREAYRKQEAENESN